MSPARRQRRRNSACTGLFQIRRSDFLPLAKPEPEGVQYDRLVPHLVALVKELRDRIEVLEAAGQ